MTAQEMIKRYDICVIEQDGSEMIKIRANIEDAKKHNGETVMDETIWAWK